MEESIKVEYSLDSPCYGCLTSNRPLKPIYSDDLDMFLMFLGNELIEDKYTKMSNLTLCWECRAILWKSKLFQNRIRKAHKFMAQLTEYQELQSLSSLQHGYFEFFDSNEEIKDENDSNDIKQESVIDNTFMHIDSSTDIDFEESIDSYDVKIENNIPNNNENTPEDKVDDNDDHNFVVKEENVLPKKKKKMQSFWRTDKSFAKHFVPAPKGFNTMYYTEVEIMKADLQNLRQCEEKLKQKKKIKKLDGRPYKCNNCTEEFNTETDCLVHNNVTHGLALKESTTDDGRGYRCKFCDHTALSVKAIQIHSRSSHTVLYRCKLCDDIPGKLLACRLHYHVKHKKIFICHHCDKRRMSKQSMIDHLNKYHPMNVECKPCGRQFKTRSKLKSHNLSVHGIDRFGNKVGTEDRYCVECDRLYATAQHYRGHVKHSVKHSGRKPKVSVPCPNCDKVFSGTKTMKNHFNLIHEKIKKHYCEVCDKSFITGFSLRQHNKLVHLKIDLPRDKICEECGRGFKHNNVLKKHILTHTGERPHGCPQCPARFAQRTAMTSHLRNIHGKRAKRIL